MNTTPLHHTLYRQLEKSTQYNSTLFSELYGQVYTDILKGKANDKAHCQKEFLHVLNLILIRFPQYYELLIELIDSDDLQEEHRDKIVNHLSIHFGSESIHHLKIDHNNLKSYKVALDKMYTNIFDEQKRYQLTHMLSDESDFFHGNAITDPGNGMHYTFEVTHKNGAIGTYKNDKDIEQHLFDELVKHDEWRSKVIDYITLINAIHYTLGSEDDIRYPDQRLIFEAPIIALLKLSSAYIPLLCDCYAVFDKWHDVSALSIGYELLPSLHNEADEMIYLYAAAYGRALANYELADHFEDAIINKLENPQFRERFVQLLAADDVAASIAITYERRNLHEEDLKDELDLRDWDEDFIESTLGEHLKNICTKDELYSLKQLYDDTIDAAIRDPHNGPITILPADLSDITGVKLNSRGDIIKEATPTATIVYNTDCASFWKFHDKNILITCDDGWIRLIDFDKRTQIAVRELTSDEEAVCQLLTTQGANDKSPVHFVTYSNGIIQGWHMAKNTDVFRIKANVDHLFLSEDGSQLGLIIDEDNDYEEPIIQDLKALNWDLSDAKEGTFISFNLVSLTETSRWMLNPECFHETQMTPDGKHLYTIGNGDKAEVIQWDVLTGEITSNHSTFRESIILSMCISPDGKKLVADTNVYELPGLEFLNSIETYEFGKPTISPDSSLIAMKGDMADSEHTYSFTNLATGQHLGAIHLEEELYDNDISFFSPCNKWFGSIIEGDLYIWDLEAEMAKTPAHLLESFEIDFPSVGSVTMEGAFIHRVKEAKGNFTNPSGKLQFTPIEQGEFSAKVSKAAMGIGRCKIAFTDIKHKPDCHTIIPQVGTTIGALLLPQSKGLQQVFDVKVIISFPEQIDKTSGESISSELWYQEIQHNEPVFIGYQFDNEQQLKSGTWIIEVQNMEDSTCLFRKLIEVEQAFTKVDYQIKKTFCGLYSDDTLPHTSISENKMIIAKVGIRFGLQFHFECKHQEAPYKLIGEMEHPPIYDQDSGEWRTTSSRSFKLFDGNSIGYFQQFTHENEPTVGKWIFRLKDPALNTIVMQEELEVISKDAVAEPRFELLDTGLYSSDEKYELFGNYPQANMLTLDDNGDVLKISKDMMFGFKCRFKNLIGAKHLAAMVYHPPIKSFFGDDTEEDFEFNVMDEMPLFIGWVMDREKAMLEGNWTIKVWENEINEDETPLFEKTFILTN